MKRLFGLALVCACALLGQDAPNMTLSQGPPRVAYQLIYGYSGSNLTYKCAAPSIDSTGKRSRTVVAIASVSTANPAVVTVTAGHGFDTNSRPVVTISGATNGGAGDDWTIINGTWTATVINTTTFSIPVDTSTLSTLSGTIVFRTTAPRNNVAEWSVWIYKYDGSSNLIWGGWLGGTPAAVNKCSDAGSTTLNIQ